MTAETQLNSEKLMPSYFFKRLDLFKNRSFCFGCIMDFFSAIAVGVSYIAFSWHSLLLYNSINAIIIFMFTWWISGAILSPLTGHFADKFSRRYIILATHVARVLLMVAYLFIGEFDSPIKVYVFTTIWGIILAFFMPAMLIFVRELFEDDRYLMYANSTIDGIFEIGMVLGMSLGGLLVTTFSMHDILYFLLFCTIVAFVASLKICPARIIEKPNVGFVKDWLNVYQYLKKYRFVFWYYLAQISFTSLFMIVPAFLAPYAKNVLGATSLEFGLIETSFSIGFILGTLLMPWCADNYGEVRVLVVTLVFSAILYFILSLLHHVMLAIICYFVIGLCISCWAIVMTLAQKNTTVELQGMAQGVAYGASGFVVMCVYGLFLFINLIDPLPSNKWFYFTIIIALLTLVPLLKGHRQAIKFSNREAI